jgi:hypothetical protein
MKSHVLRPLYVVVALVGAIFFLRSFIVPHDFGVHESGYMYGWHRKSNEEEWGAFKAKFRTAEYCKDCHGGQHSLLMASPHGRIECENCHEPARDHPEKPERLAINRTREHCLRCHAYLPYMATERRLIPGIKPEEHNPGAECVACHNPHSPKGRHET